MGLFRIPIELELLEGRIAPQLFELVDRNRDRLRRWLTWVDDTREVEDTELFPGWDEVADDPEPFLSLEICDTAWLEQSLPVLLAASEKVPPR